MLNILIAPHPLLKKKAEPVGSVGAAEKKLLDEMLSTMYASNGIGLAAPQIGISQRILVMDVSDTEQPTPIMMVDPEIIWASEENKEFEEGCLSFPEEYAKVIRPMAVDIQYLDQDGESRLLKATGLTAVCVQHEIDHLNGVNFVDHLSRLRRDLILRRMRKLSVN